MRFSALTVATEVVVIVGVMADGWVAVLMSGMPIMDWRDSVEVEAGAGGVGVAIGERSVHVTNEVEDSYLYCAGRLSLILQIKLKNLLYRYANHC